MLNISDNEFNALISLLDDDDNEVFSHVNERLLSFGKESIPKLELVLGQTTNIIIQHRLEDIINHIHFNNIKDLFNNWIKSGGTDLLEGALLVAQIEYTDIDEFVIRQKINSIAKAVWLELNSTLTPLEEIQVINHVLYQLYGYFCQQTQTSDVSLGFLNKVLETKKGNSLSLGILYLLIAQKNDLPVYGVNLPYHFIICYSKKLLTNTNLSENKNEKDILFYINPINKGVAFSRTEITSYLEQMKIKVKSNYYCPCNNIEIIKSLVYNQLSCYDHNNDILKANKLKEIFGLFE